MTSLPERLAVTPAPVKLIEFTFDDKEEPSSFIVKFCFENDIDELLPNVNVPAPEI